VGSFPVGVSLPNRGKRGTESVDHHMGRLNLLTVPQNESAAGGIKKVFKKKIWQASNFNPRKKSNYGDTLGKHPKEEKKGVKA